MNQNRKKYDKEFKQKQLNISAKGNAKEIADELGVDKGLLYRWRKEFKTYEGNSFSGHSNPKMTDLERENASLCEEFRDVKME